MKDNSVFDCKVLQLNKIHNRAGNITIIENSLDIPFDVKRIYYLYDIPSNETRGGHAHKELYQLVIGASGSFNIKINDGTTEQTVFLNSPDQGLLIVPGIWRDLSNFSSGSVCLVFASEFYSEEDYIRDYKEFLTFKE
jgi:dTDP-4-dehydrorhamnose 3,5-epimerase-like enzyme